jgi:hypothetical protein
LNHPKTNDDAVAGSGDAEESGDDFVAALAKILGDHGDDDADVVGDLNDQHDAKRRARAADKKFNGSDDNGNVSSGDDEPQLATYPLESFNVFLANLGLADAFVLFTYIRRPNITNEKRINHQ